ncbi:GntR family transcriptional regulator [Deinococcus hopiensis]|uniref:GntR family transcriptional regulator, histidine utilization repressor n=1 Tax=Deinococcus hopiensis KR-140 TaxID=695939 RepID=A0A1W1UPB8_9DEIO|nr:GntR family transcriptional regulator [Deinococcus hopiensis]SMB82681.1 GntR family transcriptional regulator, histidine utilization repressor [Deinococcus hopiensis KR-140]
MSKYPAIKAAIKERLLGNEYADGHALPSEPQLAREFSVSRMTARRAIDELEREGYLYRVQGAGTFPSGKRFQQGGFPVSLFADWSSHPNKRTQVLRAELLPATPEIAAVLNVSAGDAFVFIHRVRWDKETPIVIEKRYVDAQALPDLLSYDLSKVSVHDLLASQATVPLTRVEQYLQAVNVWPEEAGLLQLAPGTATLLIRRTAFSGNRRVSYVNYWVRSDRFSFQNAFTP